MYKIYIHFGQFFRILIQWKFRSIKCINFNFINLKRLIDFRRDGLLLEAVDVKCSPQSEVYAPFDGDLYFWKPFGNHANYECADEGVRIEGTGQWQGK